ncbi:Adenomatous polyposis coli protein 2 [Bagarius yarrelli]|uniref:Adenomatous polyposis coli protein 2 n=1 Tax=Bagarius yarrelli TaxID=175774 RepID=A0A556U5P5_BAGYA|nr:Adenomatous polyposis coli protein 2 [Bagarius yarrelli]
MPRRAEVPLLLLEGARARLRSSVKPHFVMMSNSVASYDQLVRQVEDLRKENSHLRRELEDNSHHLSKLENETSDMKEVLKHLQGKLEQEAGTLASSGRTDVLDQLKELHMDLTNYYELKYQPPHLNDGEDRMQLQSSSISRTMLLNEIEKEEKDRRWYYAQLQGLSQRLAELPRIDTFSIQMDLIRQQLEFEVQQLRSVMEERFGTSDEMVQRTQIRVTRLEQLDKELQEARCPQEKIGQSENQNSESLSKSSLSEMENGASSSTMEAPGEAGNKVEMMFWLLSMLASRDREEMSRVLLAMSSSQESCIAMRKSGCVALLVQILHDVSTGKTPEATGCSREARSRASAALHNIVYSQPDEGQARREMRVLHVLEQIRSHCENSWDWIENHLETLSPSGTKNIEPLDPQLCQAVCAIMKLSFEEDYRRAMNELGGLQAIAELMQLEQELYGMQNEPMNMALRRYAGMALTNLTYGDVVNKATLCSKKSCLQAIVAQLASDSEELHQVVSSILRNLSWRADITSKRALRDVGSVSALMTCALQATKESTLKSVLSALWNLSAHSTENKMAICSVDGALGFLVSTLTYQCQTNSLAIIESGGGILRNVSSLIATRDDYRQVLRDYNCLQTLLQHLRSHSLTIVSNACGTLWNLSARSPKDQELLWDLGAVSMLRNLIHSKHKMIAMGSAAALRNLLTNRPLKYKDTAVISPGSCMPSLYMRKQKALEAELDAKHLAETFDSIEKQSPRHMNINKPLRHIESLAKDYASDSGCFDDDEAPNVSSSIETGTFSMLSMFLNNSNFLQSQPRRREGEPERDMESLQIENKQTQPPGDEVTMVADKLAKKITNTVAKIDRLVEDITMHTSSEDSFSLNSEDHFADWNYGSEDLHEARAKLCSPCHLSDNSFSHKDHLSKSHALLRLKTTTSSLSNDSLNSGSNSEGCYGNNDQPQSSIRPAEQKRPNKLELKVAHKELLNSGATLSKLLCQNEIPERDSDITKDFNLPDCNTEEKGQEPFISTPATVSTRVSSDASIPTIKLSPSYQHVSLSQNAMLATDDVQASQTMKKQAWVSTLTTAENISKLSPMCSSRSPIVQLETPQKYSVENTPICFSRCSSLSSLSSGDGDLDRQSENDLESDSSLEIIEVEDSNIVRKVEEEDETLEDLSDSQLLMTDQKTCPTISSTSDPIEIPIEHENTFLREELTVIHEDRIHSSSSDSYLHETPLVMSRCSSVSSLGSFESPSIASSIQSDPCSEMISGTVSPSDLPDSPGQTMPPSRSKTPCYAEASGPEQQNVGSIGGQWENGLRKFMEIADLKERFNLPQDLDTMIYFTVEKPLENFSCASSLSALPLHEHYVQKDVELKLTPLLNQQDTEPVYSVKRNLANYPSCVDQDQYSEGNSDDDIEILKECINSAMPSRFKKIRPTLMSTLSNQELNTQVRRSVQLPVYMVLQNKNNQMCSEQKVGMFSKDVHRDDSSYTDSAECTPVYLSSTTSLSDETLQYSHKVKGSRDWRSKNQATQQLIDTEAKRIEELRLFSRFHKSSKMESQSKIVPNQINKAINHMTPTQKLLIQSKEIAAKMTQQRLQSQSPVRQIKKQEQSLPHIELLTRKQNKEMYQSQKSYPRSKAQENTTFQSMHHPAAKEDSTYCFRYNDVTNSDKGITRSTQKQLNNLNKNNFGPHYANLKGRVDTFQRHGFQKIKQNLILEEAPPCYSLSSSLSSLSDVEMFEEQGKPQHVKLRNKYNEISSTGQCTLKTQRGQNKYEDNTSPSSVSLDSEDDLLLKCITSAMPKQKKKQPSRKRKGEAKQKQKTAKKENAHWNPEDDLDSEEMASDKDSDLNSVEWRAIQEGANTIITKLQASKSQEPSSESDSVLSFISDSSFTPKADIKNKVVKENKKANKPLDFAARKPVPNLPVVFRGRTVIYTPKKEKTLSQRPPPKKVAPKPDGPKNPSLAQHRSRSLHRLGHLSDSTQLSLPKRSSTPPARIPKSSSSGSSQSSTPSRQPQKKVTSPTQQNQNTLTSDPDSSPDKKRGAFMSNQNTRSADSKTQKSPVRIPFMQNSSKESRAISPLVSNQNTSISRQNSQLSVKRISPANRLDLVRMTSAYSCSSESDHNGFLRQRTFIKESSRQNVSYSRSVPTSKHVSPRRMCPGAPAVFLCSSRCQELKPAVQGSRRMHGAQGTRNGREQGILKQTLALPRANSSDTNFTVKRPARRTSSESPCRMPQKTVPEPNLRATREDVFKRYSSSPSINILSRVTSRSSLRSSSSDSSARAKSEKDTKQRQNRSGARNANNKITWRRIRDEDVPQILKSTLPPTALPLVPSPEGHKPMPPPLPGKLPTITLISRKTSDATVQTEDLSTNKINSSTSPTFENGSKISEEVAKMALLRRISLATGTTMQDGEADGSLKNYSTTFQSVDSTHNGGIGPFRQSAPSKAARITPFNYVPSPMTYCSQETQSQASTIHEKSGEKLES